MVIFIIKKEFNELYQLNMCLLEYYGVIGLATNVPLDDSSVQSRLYSNKKGSELHYYTLTFSDVQNTAVSKWQYHFHSGLSWSIIYLKPFITTQETKLKWFQYIILHRILTTNCFAYKLKLI